MSNDERTFVMVKPDGVQRGLIGEITSRFEHRGLKLVGAKALQIDQEGKDATHQVRRMVGETDPAESPPGTIRGDYGLDLGRNLIHASDHEDPGSNEREIDLFFDDEELLDYDQTMDQWNYE
mgnify:CR=1 FL=1